MNAAQQIHRAIGVAIPADSERQQRNASYTKSGPGRRANTVRAIKTLRQKKAGAYGRGLRNWIKQTQAVTQSIKMSRRMANQL